MTKIIYIVTDGDHDDYQVHAVYETKELAEKYVKLYGGDIEEYNLNPYQKELEKGLTLFQVFMRKDGTVDDVQKFLPYASQKIGVLYFSTRIMNPFDEFFVYQLVSDSEEKAIKIVNEKRLMILFENLWGQEHIGEIRQRSDIKP